MLHKHLNGMYDSNEGLWVCIQCYSKFLDKWILCLGTEVNKQIKMLEDVE